MNFGQAVEQLKSGQRVARAGWNGKGMWVCLMPAAVIPEGLVNERTRKFVPSGELRVGAYLVLWTAHGVWQPGWNASTPDILADDWEVVPGA